MKRDVLGVQFLLSTFLLVNQFTIQLTKISCFIFKLSNQFHSQNILIIQYILMNYKKRKEHNTYSNSILSDQRDIL